MSHEAFQEAIFQEPDDDAVRLIYADWLDENGEPFWAEFIRVQCELATLTPASEDFVRLKEREEEMQMLLPDQELAPPLEHMVDELDLASGYSHSYRRGFPSTFYLEPYEPDALTEAELHQICERLETVIVQSAIQGLELEDFQAKQLEILFQHRVMKRVNDLTVQWWDEWVDEEDDSLADHAAVVASATNLSRLRSLKLETMFTDDTLQALTHSPHMKNLESFEFTPSDVTPEGFEIFATSPMAKRLRSLTCGYTRLSGEQLEALTTVVWPQLYSLEMDWNLTPEALQVLAKSQAFPNLVSLELRSNQMGLSEVEALCQNECWQLRSLDLSYCELRSRDARLLARSPLVEQLRSLSLSSNRIGSQGLEALSKSPLLRELRQLDLSFNELTAGKAQALNRGEMLQNLTSLDLSLRDEDSSMPDGMEFIKALELPCIRHLSLSGIPLGARGVQVLVKKDWFHNLRVLNLSWCRIGKAGAEVLLEAIDSANLVRLYLNSNPNIPVKVRDRFREQFGEKRVSLD